MKIFLTIPLPPNEVATSSIKFLLAAKQALHTIGSAYARISRETTNKTGVPRTSRTLRYCTQEVAAKNKTSR